MAVTLVQIARASGVSHATVSRVLNGKGGDFISRATRERVLRAAIDLGYQPFRRRAAGLEAHLFGLWLPETEGLYARIGRELTRWLARRGHELVTVTADRADVVRALPLHGVFALDMLPHLDALLHGPAPYVAPVLCCGNAPCAGVDSLVFDRCAAARAATAYLLDTGCRRVAVVLPAFRNTPGHGRRDGYAAAMAAAGREPEYIELPGDSFEAEDAARALARHGAEHGAPDGLFCYSDRIALGALRGLADAGVPVPGKTRVVGLDGMPINEFLQPSLSSMELDVERFAAKAGQWMTARLADRNQPPRIGRLPYRLAERESSRP